MWVRSSILFPPPTSFKVLFGFEREFSPYLSHFATKLSTHPCFFPLQLYSLARGWGIVPFPALVRFGVSLRLANAFLPSPKTDVWMRKSHCVIFSPPGFLVHMSCCSLSLGANRPLPSFTVHAQCCSFRDFFFAVLSSPHGLGIFFVFGPFFAPLFTLFYLPPDTKPIFPPSWRLPSGFSSFSLCHRPV